MIIAINRLGRSVISSSNKWLLVFSLIEPLRNSTASFFKMLLRVSSLLAARKTLPCESVVLSLR